MMLKTLQVVVEEISAYQKGTDSHGRKRRLLNVAAGKWRSRTALKGPLFDPDRCNTLSRFIHGAKSLSHRVGDRMGL